MATKQKKYSVILADPPWDINQKGNYGAIKHYKLMTLERIKAMPIADLAEDNCHLYLWTTNGCLREAYDVVEAWGFKTKSVCIWLKMKLGLGKYFRNSTEALLFAVRGKLETRCKSQPNIITGPVLRHSEKPLEQYTIIDRMSPPDAKKLELFARHRQPGYDVWGLEAPGGSDIDIPGYPVPDSPSCIDKKVDCRRQHSQSECTETRTKKSN